jgi:hypothetical protein
MKEGSEVRRSIIKIYTRVHDHCENAKIKLAAGSW